MNDLFGIIQSRRSLRRYRPAPVPQASLRRLLTAAAWAPSAHNRQPWRFVVVQSDHAKRRLAGAMAARWLEDGASRGRVVQSRQRLDDAPAWVIFCMTLADMDDYPDARRRQAERDMAVQSVAMAGQNLLLAAHAEGLAACWVCAPLFCPEVVRDVLALPADYEALGLVTLGYPRAEDRARTKERYPLETRVTWR
ncbi:MAG: nitroreductase family protein [Anaerolineae bacterium]|nr:nitroreductase family protein [Anaerolineae bacterium]